MAYATPDSAVRTSPGRWSGRYNDGEIVLHWVTAALVISLFALAQIWGFLPRGHLRETLEGLHVSLGCLLVVTVITRVVWRWRFGRRLAHPGLTGKLAHVGHGLLYLLLLTMIVTGPLKRWAAGHALNFFWLFSIPSPMAAQPALHGAVSFVHFWAAWTIIVVAGLHALVALFHHYALKDGVLRRMMPGRRSEAS